MSALFTLRQTAGAFPPIHSSDCSLGRAATMSARIIATILDALRFPDMARAVNVEPNPDLEAETVEANALAPDEMILFRNTMRINDGHLYDFKRAIRDAVNFVERNGPQLMVQTVVDEGHMMAVSYQLYRNSEAILNIGGLPIHTSPR